MWNYKIYLKSKTQDGMDMVIFCLALCILRNNLK